MLFSLILFLCVFLAKGEEKHQEQYTNDWVVRLIGGRDVADELAGELDYVNLGELKSFPNTYLMRKKNHPNRSKRHAGHITKRLADDKRVEWAEQQIAKRRAKRDIYRESIADRWIPSQSENNRFNDELWPDQWYLHDTRSMAHLPQLDLRTTPVWDMGITGKGVVVTVMDDGLEWNHTDLIDNYDPEASWDSNDNDPDPFPRYDASDSNNHGTRCAGEIAMKADNSKCGVGVAYNARIGGIRMLDGSVTDVAESVSIAHNINHIDVFSASWGPTDDGMTVDGPNRLALEAFQKGAHEGRGGKGVIYIWASGNGGSKGDNCNCDGYTNSIYTLSVGSASQRGEFPWYGERCASTMTTAYSSGAYTDQKITTTDLHGQCTMHHTGTSAAAPLAAGIVALVLEANPSLTWRDMQHLVVWNSEYIQLQNNKGWKQNAAGLMYNSRFGFGLMNAESMVKAALNWTTVPQQKKCKAHTISSLPISITSAENSEVEVVLRSDGCKDTPNEINYLEHVEVTLDIDYNHRGALDVFLFSPSESVSMLLSRRERDSSLTGFRNWTFLTVHFWGENPSGEFKLLIRDKVGSSYHGLVKSVFITMHGTKEKPKHMKKSAELFVDEKVLRSVIDQTPEFVEQNPRTYDDVINEIDASNERKDELDWSDLVGKQLRKIGNEADTDWQRDDFRYSLPDYIKNERHIDYSSYFDYK